MIPYLGASLTLLLAFAILITYHYVADLRAENKRLRASEESAWRLSQSSHENRMKSLESATPRESETRSDPLPFSGIGITQIRDRELRKQREREAETQPRFDKSALSQPTEQEIIEAARLAASKPN